ncbi:DUF3027 domain-containing protein [Micrococcus sp.]|uniref:DUF3027 domain-containing protein n=1 Tax=Micrococcus sp. TaxID=1271 RepID=UPI002A918317|nr:DUF3027 domain-containing protein [Micrococcus sp.]MDY6055759.1 DUF3027 domain-containing protein [Micrococcus sp.]
MTETSTPTSPAPAPAPARPRRRSVRRDEVLTAAVAEARAGLAQAAPEESIGEHLGATADDDRLVTHRFEARLPGYAGWVWYSTVARAPRSRRVTLCETGLEAGDGALVAPPWVPYEERVSEEERERLRAVAEGRVPEEQDAEAQSEEPADAEARPEAPAEGKGTADRA